MSNLKNLFSQQLHKTRLPVVLLLLCNLPAGVMSDALSQPPQPWQERVEPITEVDLSGAEPYARKVITEQRNEVAHLFADNSTAAKELAEGFGRLGALYHVFDLVAAAQTGYHNAMALDPDNFRWVYYAGYLASRNGRHEEAVKLYLIAQRLQPDYPPLPLRLGESWLELSQLDKATSALQTATAQPGLRALALFYLAQIDLMQRYYNLAIEKLEEVLELDPKADQAHYPLARALRAKGENERSRQQMALRGKRLPEIEDPMIKELEGLNQGARQFFAQGLQTSKSQDFTTAAQAFAQGLEIEPDNNNARVSYARALFLSGKNELASQQLGTVLEQNPKHALAHFLSAIILENNGEISQAKTGYQQVLQLDPNHYGAHYCLANRLFQARDFQQSATHYAAALEISPDIPPARLYELLALKQSGEVDAEISKRLEALISAHPDQQILRYTLIRMLVLSEDKQVRDLERARQLINTLVQEAFIPPHVELQALVAASLGHFSQAANLQQQVLPSLYWVAGDSYQQAEQILTTYQQNELPDLAWYRDTRLLLPPKTDAHMLFREYPSVVPY